MDRRSALVALLSPALAGLWRRAAADAPEMRVTRIDTVYWESRDDAPFWPHWTWLRLHTDKGLVGLGETYPRNATEAALVHTDVARRLLGRDPRDIEAIWSELFRAFDYQVSGGTEMRVLSAVDLALWDLLGQALGVPVYRLIGGRSNPRVPVYNTCFPLRHDFNVDPVSIMREVKTRYGITGIKIWPFDGAAQRSRHQLITPDELDRALAPLRKLRETFADTIEIMLELHSNWNLPSALRIAKAVEPYRPMWLEDVLLTGSLNEYRELAASTSTPILLSERMAGPFEFEALLGSGVARYVSFDLTWCGGLSLARKVAAAAEARQLLVVPHTAGGPLLFYASTHLTTAATNVGIQESCQRFFERDWPAMLEDPIVPVDGTVAAPDLPGFGMRVKPEVWSHPKAVVHTSTA
ncbi:MAG TPA: mandelate racemase/muconate lactonizing enzyme family protein [Vicinamibacteria bacterium]|nr:mandelate racemase/muconate lactonizing enzyme family protein [Vicinamibacteria bacterium]